MFRANRFPMDILDTCNVSVEPDGSVAVRCGFHSHGQGHATTFAQLAADEFGVPIESVRILEGDTDSVPTPPARLEVGRPSSAAEASSSRRKVSKTSSSRWPRVCSRFPADDLSTRLERFVSRVRLARHCRSGASEHRLFRRSALPPGVDADSTRPAPTSQARRMEMEQLPRSSRWTPKPA